ncbi:hypothetical protein [Roseitranquillus sediminis]|uniref:hypothetical protein n=1 Tax=Roseitranquillus sediminis TaxID=2809051 RepID=UPI001D0C9B99|nr:hypothetical protein [Roseitranquillus sediminis]MBM9594804.1 hypothetical protein [Roseitranquillus sediminis]
MIRPAPLALAAALALSACAPMMRDDTSVRAFRSNEVYGGDALLYLFVFNPERPRALSERKRLARAHVRGMPGCSWVDAPDDVLASETAQQGARYTETLLVAPVRCS